MSVDNPDEIDFVSQSQETGTVTMVISDHLPWDDLPGHLVMLQQKIANYRQFIQSGNINTLTPSARNNLKAIEVFFMIKPPRGPATAFLEDIGSELGKVGIDFKYRKFEGPF